MRDAPAGAGAEHGVANGLVGIGDALATTPATLDEAVAATGERYGAKAARMLQRFAELSDGTSVWTRLGDGSYRLDADRGTVALRRLGRGTDARYPPRAADELARPAVRRARGASRSRGDVRARRPQPAADA